jgi:hypothetical protein
MRGSSRVVDVGYPVKKQMIYCDSCERHEPVSEASSRQWRVLRIEDNGSLLISRAFWFSLFQRELPNRKQVCGDEGVQKLVSRWLTARSLDIPRPADPARLFGKIGGWGR